MDVLPHKGKEKVRGALPTGLSIHAFYFCTHMHSRFEQFNKKYLRRFLIREDQQAHSILRVYQELERRGQRGDAEASSV